MSPRAWVGAVALGFAAFSSAGCGRSQAPVPDRAAPDVSGVAAAPGAVTEAPEVATAPGTAAPPGAAPAPAQPASAAPSAQPASAAPSAQPASAAPSMGAAGIRKPGARGPSPDAKPKLKCGRTYCNAAGECFAPSPPQCE
ncbi:hypothetical protein [Sorangium sp. So ce381]|uniref:hypothetical protein n=1 Tax=Sorangium sp. So ce381 TaxID=3133307 RepID=UPI003F5C79D3